MAWLLNHQGQKNKTASTSSLFLIFLPLFLGVWHLRKARKIDTDGLLYMYFDSVHVKASEEYNMRDML
ncbi:hypothetical protein TorRG33x02_209270 [Trema orientale]|uniref:Transmembrane protein n=1 Tax=Trema orientale TaxID=63057 RepID=A0A2P5ECG6_TREOI|nr:hypothetical protein TorRG33x02_209270 [Trema orientale]